MQFNYKTLFLLSTFTSLLTSCLSVTEITVKQDGSAHVAFLNGSYYPKDFFKSDQITDLTWMNDSTTVAFNIKTIDSLGNYLYSDFEKDYFKFHYSNDTLTFSDGNTSTYRYRRYPCWTSEVRITSEENIKSVQTKNSFVKQKKNTVVIEKAGRKFKKQKHDTKVVMVFGK